MFEGSEETRRGGGGELDRRHPVHPQAFFLWPRSRLVLVNYFKTSPRKIVQAHSSDSVGPEYSPLAEFCAHSQKQCVERILSSIEHLCSVWLVMLEELFLLEWYWPSGRHIADTGVYFRDFYSIFLDTH